MHQVTLTRTLHGSLADTWDLIDDFGAIAEHHPLVEQSPILNGIERGLGAERACHFDNGAVIEERIVEHEPERLLALEITDFGSFPLKAGGARFELQPEGVARTRVTLTASFDPKYGLLGDLMAHLVMKRQFAKSLGGLLKSWDETLRVSALRFVAA